MSKSKKLGFLCALMAGCMAFSASFSNASMVRLKTIGKVKGVRENQLIGYGLVVGLQRTGDTQRVQSTLQSISNMLSQFGIKVDTAQLRTMNVAAVMVTAQLPGLLKSGDKIDVNLSSLGDARSLQGGTLIQTPLQGGDGQVYAVAQGPLAVGGYSVEQSTDHPLIKLFPEATSLLSLAMESASA